MYEDNECLEVTSVGSLQFSLILEQRLQFLSQHNIAFDFQFALHVSLLGI